MRDWAKVNQRKGFRRAWADLRAAGWVINKKKVQRLWREEGLRVNVRKIRKRAGASTTPITEADAPKVLWAIDFQFDSTTEGRKFKIASMVDEHTRQSVLNIVERSIPAEDLVTALGKAFALWGGPPQVLRCDNGPEFISEALRTFCEDQVGIGYVPPGQPWKNGYIESFNNRVRDECLNMNEFHSLLEARVVIEDWKEDYNNRHRHSSLAYRTLMSTLPAVFTRIDSLIASGSPNGVLPNRTPTTSATKTAAELFRCADLHRGQSSLPATKVDVDKNSGVICTPV
ncbi:hypothetical protein GCM10020255_004340 [Rhodococcus baikonurensis]